MPDGETIRILQFSDCHISADPGQAWYGRNALASLDHVIRYINQNETDTTAILATGDLSHDGSDESYHLLATCFRQLNARVYSLPGNHDASAMYDILSEVGHFITGNWLVVMLNSSVPGKESGYLDTGELERLVAVVEQHPECHVLVAVHHPPMAVNSDWIDSMQITNGNALLAKCAHYPQIHAVICGHVHQQQDMQHDGYRLMTTPSTCHQFVPSVKEFAIDDAAPGYRWLELHDDGHIDSGIIRVEDDE